MPRTKKKVEETEEETKVKKVKSNKIEDGVKVTLAKGGGIKYQDKADVIKSLIKEGWKIIE